MKTYTGIELLEAIEEKEIEEGTRFKIINGAYDGFVAYIEDENIKVNMFGREGVLGTKALIESEFEELEKEDIDIQAIEEFIIPDNVSERIVNEVNIIKIFEKQNKLIQAVKQLDRQINNK